MENLPVSLPKGNYFKALSLPLYRTQVIVGSVAYLSPSYPSIASFKEEEVKDGHFMKMETPSRSWESLITEKTKSEIKATSASLNELLKENNQEKLKRYIFERLQQNQDLQSQIEQFKPAQYRKQTAPFNSSDKFQFTIRIDHIASKSSITLDQLSDSLLPTIAIRTLWNYQNLLIDSDVFSKTKIELNYISSLSLEPCMESNCIVEHPDVSLLLRCLQYRQDIYWIKNECTHTRIEFFKNYPELQADLFRENELVVNLSYNLKPIAPQKFFAIKEKLATAFPIYQYDNVFTKILEQKASFQIQDLREYWKYLLAKHKVFILTLANTEYHIPKLLAESKMETKNAFKRWHILQLKKAKKNKKVAQKDQSNATQEKRINDLVAYIKENKNLKSIKTPENIIPPSKDALTPNKHKKSRKKKSKEAHKQEEKNTTGNSSHIEPTIINKAEDIALPPRPFPTLPVLEGMDKQPAVQTSYHPANSWTGNKTLAEKIRGQQ